MTNYPITTIIDGAVVTTFENKSQIINGTNDRDWPNNTLLEPIERNGVLLTQVENRVLQRTLHLGVVKILEVFIAKATVIFVIGTAFVIARLFVRTRLLRQFYIDDWFILIAMIAGTLSYISWVILSARQMAEYTIQGNLSMFRDIYPDERYYVDLKYSQIAPLLTTVFMIFQANFARLSILYTFHRFSIATDRKTRNIRFTIHIAAAIMLITAVPLGWLSIDPCWPPRGKYLSWADGMQPTCLKHGPNDHVPFPVYGMLTTAVVNVVLDLFCFLLPFLIFRLGFMTAALRRGLYVLFGFGLVVLLLSILRIVQTVDLIQTLQAFDVDVVLRTWDVPTTTPFIWGMAEANCVMIGASLPVIARPFWRWAKDWIPRSWFGEYTEEEESTYFTDRQGDTTAEQIPDGDLANKSTEKDGNSVSVSRTRSTTQS